MKSEPSLRKAGGGRVQASVVSEVLGSEKKVTLFLNHLQCILTPKYTYSYAESLDKEANEVERCQQS